MTKRHIEDPVIQELWSIKDATAARYSTVGEYLSHLRQQQKEQRKKATSKRRAKAA
jgi:hypothetical protein